VLVPGHARQRLREHPRVAARVAEVADGARDLALHRREGRLEPGHRGGVEDLLLLAVLGEERHLLDAGLELGRVAMQVERALADRVVLDPLGPDQLVHHRLAVLAQAELDERVAARPRRRALAQEAQSPGVEPEVGRQSHPDGRLGAPQRLPERARRPRRRPGKGVAGRDDPGVAAGGLQPEPVPLLDQRDLVAGPGQKVRGRDADDTAAEDQGLHGCCRAMRLRRARGVKDRAASRRTLNLGLHLRPLRGGTRLIV